MGVMNTEKRRKLSFFLVWVFCGAGLFSDAWAEERPDSLLLRENTRSYFFHPVLIVDKKRGPGESLLDGNLLRSIPNYTGSITGALTLLSEVQFSNEERSALTGGEIRPSQISINGAKPYENSFLVDGIGNTNILNPSGLGAENNNASADFNELSVHGAEQEMFYDATLIGAVTTYTSNIPARYGGFVGGVVSADLRNPRSDRWHVSLDGRYTRSSWFVLRGVDGDSEAPDNQPEFSIHHSGIVAEGPVGGGMSLLVSASNRRSGIPLVRRKRVDAHEYSYDRDEQFRNSDNYFAKFVAYPAERLRLSFDATYAPYAEKRWRAAWADSDWKVINDAYRFSAQADWATDIGTVVVKAAYRANGYSRDAANNYRYSYSNYVTGAGEQYGGVGDATVESRNFDFRLDFYSRELQGLPLENVVAGFAFNNSTSRMWNESAASDIYIESGNTIRHTRAAYEEYRHSEFLNTLALYAEADFAFGRLRLSPGIRLDYDDYTGNVDVAHRLKAEFDLFGNGAMRLVFGCNRYYGTTLRAYAFDRFRPFITNQWVTNTVTGETVQTVTDRVGIDKSYIAKDLDTPFSDEITGGFYGSFGDFSYSLNGVRRRHRNQLLNRSERLPDGHYRYWLTNEGRGSYEGVDAMLSFATDGGSWGKHVFRIGATKSWIKTVNGGYSDNTFSESYAIERDYFMVFYNGALIPRSELPADNFNAPLVLTFIWQGGFLRDRLRLYSVNRWRDASKGLKPDRRRSSETPYGTTSGSQTSPSSFWLNADGTFYHDAFVKGNISGGCMSDLSVEFDLFRSSLFSATFIVDVLNVFNVGMDTDVREGGTVRGRGYYAGLRCVF